MPRLNEQTPERAEGPVGEIYHQVKEKMGGVPNIFTGMANSPAALRGYLSLSEALAGGELDEGDREALYLAVSEGNGCVYCVSAHTMLAKGVGLSEDETRRVRQFGSDDERRSALLAFAKKVIETKGFVADEDLATVREAGYTDGQIVETIGYIALATFSNFFNHVHETELDFPEASPLASRVT